MSSPRIRKSTAVRRAALGLVPVALALLPGSVSASPRVGSHDAAPPVRLLSYPMPGQEQSAWFDTYKDLKDPTLTYTQKYRCKEFTPAGKADLYPYYVPTRNYEFEYHNNSSGITVTPNSTTTGDMDGEGVAFFVTSLHLSGDYALKLSIDCQSNDPESPGKLSRAKSEDVDATSAKIGFTINREAFNGHEGFKYYVEYGIAPAEYTQRSEVVVPDSLPEGNTDKTIELHGLEPSTTYHYRVALVTDPGGTSYSGADQTFTTASSPGHSAAEDQVESGDLLKLSFRHIESGEGAEIALPNDADHFLFEPTMNFSSASDGLDWQGGKTVIRASCAVGQCEGTATAAVDADNAKPLRVVAIMPTHGEVLASWADGPLTLLPAGGGEVELQPR